MTGLNSHYTASNGDKQLNYDFLHSFDLGSGLWKTMSPQWREQYFRTRMGHANTIIWAAGLPDPEIFKMKQIVMVATEAERLFSRTAVQEPTEEECDQFFADFIIRCLKTGCA